MKIIDKISTSILFVFLFTVLFVNIWSHLKLDESSKCKLLQDYYFSFVSTFFSSEYAFFSPDIVDGYTIIMLSKNSEDDLIPVNLEFSTVEMNNKLFCVMHRFYEEENVRDVFAYSLSNTFFEQNPQVDSVYFTFSQYKLPSMSEYQNGKRPSLSPFFIKEFSVNR